MRKVDAEIDEPQVVSEAATILVIDDEEAMRDACCQALVKDGYRTRTAENGNSGLQRIKEAKPDLVLVDLKMPGISGMDLLERIRNVDPNIVSVVITGYATVESAVEAMKRNAYDFLIKPFTPDQLRIVTKRGLERRRLVIESARLRREKEIMKKNFVTLVSHQLRSPLASAKQCLGVLREGFVGDVADGQRAMIEKADKYIDGLMLLINNWLDMSRIKSGEITDKFAPVALPPMLSETVELLSPLAADIEVTTELNSDRDLPPICGDQQALQQAFTNVISNGIKYNSRGERSAWT